MRTPVASPRFLDLRRAPQASHRTASSLAGSPQAGQVTGLVVTVAQSIPLRVVCGVIANFAQTSCSSVGEATCATNGSSSDVPRHDCQWRRVPAGDPRHGAGQRAEAPAATFCSVFADPLRCSAYLGTW